MVKIVCIFDTITISDHSVLFRNGNYSFHFGEANKNINVMLSASHKSSYFDDFFVHKIVSFL